MHSRATDGRSASKCQGKWPDQTLDQAFGLPEGAGSDQHLAFVLQEGRENANIDAGLGFIWRISVKAGAIAKVLARLRTCCTSLGGPATVGQDMETSRRIGVDQISSARGVRAHVGGRPWHRRA